MNKLQSYIDKDNIAVFDIPLPRERLKGLWCEGDIYMNVSIETEAEYSCVLAEELGHYYTSDGNSLDYRQIKSQREEIRARRWAFEKILPVCDFIKAFEYGCRNKFETADFLNIAEKFLEESVEYYKVKYGICTCIGNYVLYFDPLEVMKKYNSIEREAVD